VAAFAGFAEKHEIKEIIMQWYKDIYFSFDVHFCPPPPQNGEGDMEMPGARPLVRPFKICCKRYNCCPIDFKLTHILEISRISSKLGKIRKKIVRMAAI
jgi:hypothetical protein